METSMPHVLPTRSPLVVRLWHAVAQLAPQRKRRPPARQKPLLIRLG
jgi:hypothetical protein